MLFQMVIHSLDLILNLSGMFSLFKLEQFLNSLSQMRVNELRKEIEDSPVKLTNKHVLINLTELKIVIKVKPHTRKCSKASGV